METKVTVPLSLSSEATINVSLRAIPSFGRASVPMMTMFTTLSGCSISGMGRGISMAEGRVGPGKFSHGSTDVGVGPGVGVIVSVTVGVAVTAAVGKTGSVAGTNGMKEGVSLGAASIAGTDNVQARPARPAASMTTSTTAARVEVVEASDITLKTNRIVGKFLLKPAGDEAGRPVISIIPLSKMSVYRLR